MGKVAKKLINQPEDCVEEALQGLLVAHPSIARLEGLHVAVRSDYAEAKEDQVVLISGGGSGHEPAHAGYIGPGMLTAAVLGGVFASPSVNAILSAIRAITGPQGCLLIVKNYTGDRLNFGLALEQGVSEGFKVEMVVVADDCALPKSMGARGVAGTVLVHKVAGAAAAAGKSLAEVKAEAVAAAAAMGSLGVALTTCTVPGSAPSSRLDGEEVELGIGIHGEPGIAVMPMERADSLVDRMIKRIVGSGVAADAANDQDQVHLPLAPHEDVVLLVNNLGGTPPLELSILMRRAVAVLESAPLSARVHRVFAGAYLTSLEMVGASITILKVDPLRMARLDAPTSAPGWIRAEARVPGQPPSEVPMPEPAGGKQGPQSRAAPLPAEAWARCVQGARAVAEALAAAKDRLNELDAVSGDGDCGVTLERGAKAVLAYLDESAGTPRSMPAFFTDVASAVSDSMGGTSGALLEILFRAMARAVEQDGAALPTALEVGVERCCFLGGARAGYRTMMDALLPASHALSQGVVAAAEAARAGVETTKEIAQAKAGRAKYVPTDCYKGIPDPGAEAIGIAFGALAKVFAA